MMALRLLLVVAAAYHTSAFIVPTISKPSLVTRQALWRHFVPRNEEVWNVHDSLDNQEQVDMVKKGVLASCLALVLVLPAASLAVSGGGLDFANLDITGQDFSNKSFKGKDFTQVRGWEVVSCFLTKQCRVVGFSSNIFLW